MHWGGGGGGGWVGWGVLNTCTWGGGGWVGWGVLNTCTWGGGGDVLNTFNMDWGEALKHMTLGGEGGS